MNYRTRKRPEKFRGFQETHAGAGVLADLYPPKFGLPGPNSLADLDPPRPNPLANMDPRGTQSASGFGPPSRIWTPYVIVKTHAVIRI